MTEGPQHPDAGLEGPRPCTRMVYQACLGSGVSPQGGKARGLEAERERDEAWEGYPEQGGDSMGALRGP